MKLRKIVKIIDRIINLFIKIFGICCVIYFQNSLFIMKIVFSLLILIVFFEFMFKLLLRIFGEKDYCIKDKDDNIVNIDDVNENEIYILVKSK